MADLRVATGGSVGGASSRVTSEEIAAKVEGLTMARRFVETARARAGATALRWKDGEGWGEWTWDDYADRAARTAAALRRLGVKPGDRVVIMMRNCPEFHVADVATLLCGATPVSIYNSSSADQVRYLADHCEAGIAIVEDAGFLERFLGVRADLSHLREIVVVRDPEGLATDAAVPFADLLGESPVDLDEAAAICSPHDLVTLIYTSGTTGPPKGVMLSHSNVCWTAAGFPLVADRIEFAGKRLVSYLPMAHIAERMVSHYNQIFFGTEVTTCPDPGQVARYLTEVRPQFFFGVPRVWEKIYAGVMAFAAGDPDRKAQVDRALEVGRRVVQIRLEGGDVPEDLRDAHERAETELFGPARGLIGLDQAEIAFSGAAPIPGEVFWFFLAIGLPFSEIYGLSETCGPLTWDPYDVRPGTVGRPWPGCEVRLAGDGEVYGRGGNIFLGYFRDPERTAEVLDGDGWLHTGDVGELDDDGYLKIVDRKKELIITAGGKNISPANIESALKSFPLIGQAAVVGDNRPFLSAIIVLDPEVAPAWARARGIEFTSLQALAADERVHEEVSRLVCEANERFSRVEQIKKFILVGEEWLPDSDVLTPTMKLKRRGVESRYGEEIEALYA